MTPHELLKLALDDLSEANKLWAGGRADPNTLGEITMRIQMAQAQAIIAGVELLHEHFHRHPPTPEGDPMVATAAELDDLLARIDTVAVGEKVDVEGKHFTKDH